MKYLKHILLRILFLLTILFCLGLEVYAHYSTPVCNTEITAQQEGEESIVIQNGDFIEDENINLGHEVNHFEEPLILIPISIKGLLLKGYFLSNWQPPKFC